MVPDGPRGGGSETSRDEAYWRDLALESGRLKEAADAEAERWRGVAADLREQLEVWKEPKMYRFRGRRDDEVFERDVARIPLERLAAVVEARPDLKGWHGHLDRDLGLMLLLCPTEVVAPLTVDSP